MTTDTMQAAVFLGEGQIELQERPLPQILEDDDIIIKVEAVGICGSDLHILDVPPTHPALPGVIFGHEFCGEIIKTGSAVRSLRPGMKVAVDQNPPCGRCHSCRTGSPNFCKIVFDNPKCSEPGWPNTPGQWWDGGMAEFVRVPAYFAYPVGNDTPMEHIVVAEPLGCVLNGINKVGVRTEETVVIVGGGPMGLLTTLVVKHRGAGNIIVIEPAKDRRDVAEKVGATHTVDPINEDPRDVVNNITDGEGANLVIEAVGSQLDVAIELAADEARICLLGINSAVVANFSPTILVNKEISLHGAFLMRNTMQEALDLIESGSVDLSEIVTHTLPLGDVHEGLRIAREGEGLKVVFVP